MTGAPTMPFGKHRGTPLADLDPGYLAWLAKQELRDPLKRQVGAELARRAQAAPRSGASSPSPSRPPSPPSPNPPAELAPDPDPLPEALRDDESGNLDIFCPRCGGRLLVTVYVEARR